MAALPFCVGPGDRNTVWWLLGAVGDGGEGRQGEGHGEMSLERADQTCRRRTIRARSHASGTGWTGRSSRNGRDSQVDICVILTSRPL